MNGRLEATRLLDRNIRKEREKNWSKTTLDYQMQFDGWNPLLIRLEFYLTKLTGGNRWMKNYPVSLLNVELFFGSHAWELNGFQLLPQQQHWNAPLVVESLKNNCENDPWWLVTASSYFVKLWKQNLTALWTNPKTPFPTWVMIFSRRILISSFC